MIDAKIRVRTVDTPRGEPPKRPQPDRRGGASHVFRPINLNERG